MLGADPHSSCAIGISDLVSDGVNFATTDLDMGVVAPNCGKGGVERSSGWVGHRASAAGHLAHPPPPPPPPTPTHPAIFVNVYGSSREATDGMVTWISRSKLSLRLRLTAVDTKAGDATTLLSSMIVVMITIR